MERDCSANENKSLFKFQQDTVNILLSSPDKHIVYATMGVGKTAISVVWAQSKCLERGLNKVLVITTASKSKTKDAEGRNDFELEADDFCGRGFRQSLQAFETISWNKLHDWVDDHRRDLNQYVYVFDECLPADTIVSIADGTEKKISDVNVGDIVESVNRDGVIEGRKVTRVIKKKSPKKMYCHLLSDGTIIVATGNHPHLTNSGWKQAKDIRKGDYLYERQNGPSEREIRCFEKMQSMWKDNANRDVVGKTAEQDKKRPKLGAVLFSRVHKRLSEKNCSRKSEAVERMAGATSRTQRKDVGTYEETGVHSRMERTLEKTRDGKQCESRCAGKSSRHKKSARVEANLVRTSRAKRGERAFFSAADDPLRGAKQTVGLLDPRTSHTNKRRAGISILLQSGYRKRILQNMCRVRRRFACWEESSCERRQEGSQISRVRVEDVKILEQRDIKRLGLYSEPDYVYCIDVEENHNFFANGILTHNCQRIKGWTTGMGRAFLRIAAQTENWVGFTGTPGDYWISYGAYFQACGLVRNKTIFMQKFCIVQTFKGFPEIIGYMNEPTLRAWWARISYAPDTSRIAQELPKATHKVVYFPQPKGYSKVLKMRQKLCEDGTLSEDYDDFLDNPSKTFHYLRQLCFTKDKQQWITDFLEGLGENCIFFYNYTATADAIEAIAKKVLPKGAKVWRIDGSHHQIPTKDTIGKYDIVLSQWQSGSEGLNLYFMRTWVSVELTYSYSVAQQARGRVLRHGQERPVFFYYLQTAHTIEEDIMTCLKGKGEFSEKVWMLGNGLMREKDGH